MRSVATPLLGAALAEGGGSLVAAGVVCAIDCVTGVPMAGRRRRRRGYKQAAVLTQLEARLLERARGAAQQARRADLQVRRLNVRGAFRGVSGRVAGRSVLVVDDVTTSGATLNACAEALQTAGAPSVFAWALARED